LRSVATQQEGDATEPGIGFEHAFDARPKRRRRRDLLSEPTHHDESKLLISRQSRRRDRRQNLRLERVRLELVLATHREPKEM
jgi:hypothetical protein